MTTTPRTFDRRIDAMGLPVLIEAVDEVPGRSGLRRLRGGGRVLADLPAEVVTRLDVTVGTRLDSDGCAAIRAELRRHGLRRRALGLLARRAWGRAEMQQRLAATDGAHDGDVAAVVDWLADEGLLDDAAFAEDVCRGVTRRGPVAAAHLEGLLEARGVRSEVAAAAARDAVGDTDPFEAALELARSQLRRGSQDDRLRQARRIAGTLSRRGFDAETVEHVLERLSLMPHPE